MALLLSLMVGPAGPLSAEGSSSSEVLEDLLPPAADQVTPGPLQPDDVAERSRRLAALLTRPDGTMAIGEALRGHLDRDQLQSGLLELLELPGGGELLGAALRHIEGGGDAAGLEPLLGELLRLSGSSEALTAALLDLASAPETANGTASDAATPEAAMLGQRWLQVLGQPGGGAALAAAWKTLRHGGTNDPGEITKLAETFGAGLAPEARRALAAAFHALEDNDGLEASIARIAAEKASALAARQLGLDLLEIDPALLAGQGDGLAQVTLGKRIGDRLAFTYSAVLDGDEESSLDVRWRPLDHLELRSARESTGNYALEARYLHELGNAGHSPVSGPVTLSAPPPEASEGGEDDRGNDPELPGGPGFQLGRIRAIGLRRTRPRLVESELAAAGVTTGQPFDRQRLLDATRSLRERGLFSSVEIFGVPSDAPHRRDVVVHVEERPPLRLEIGGGFDDEQGPRLGLAFSHRNLGGGGTALSLNVLGGEDEREANCTVRMPHLRGGRDDLLFSLAARQEELPGLTERRWGLGAQLSHRFRKLPHTTAQLHYEIEDVSLSDVQVSTVSPEDEGAFSRLGLALVRDSRDDLLAPTRGSLASLDLSVSAQALGSSADFGVVHAQHTGFWRLGRRLTHRSTIRLGAGWSFDDTGRLPVAERFLVGGLGTVRGYRRDSLGPRDEATGEPVGGDAYLALSQELTVELGKRFSAAVFVDAGNVFATPESFDLSDLATSAGVGLGFESPLGPLRVYYAYGFNAPPGDGPSRVHFAYGPLYF